MVVTGSAGAGAPLARTGSSDESSEGGVPMRFTPELFCAGSSLT